MRKRFVLFIVFFLAIVLAGTAYLLKTRQMTVPFLYRIKAGEQYTIALAWADSPFRIDTTSMIPLRWDSFDQHPTCRFMADPFIVSDGSDFYIFYEEMPAKTNSTWGDISVLHSTDLEQWERIGVALDEPFHLSFPNVFKYGGEWYMLPESTAMHEIRLYKATDFPLDWEYCATLITDEHAVDPAITYKDGVWYLLYSSSKGLRLCYSEDLFSDWKEHSATPIRFEDGNQETRPAGNFITSKDSLYYVVQRHDGGYGTSVVAYSVDSLTTDRFVSTRLKDNPIVEKHGNDWARDGMHQLSCVFVPERNAWLCVMDGMEYNSTVQWGWDWKNYPEFRFKHKNNN